MTVAEGTKTSKLNICRLSKFSSLSTGNEEVFLLCDRVNKDDIRIRFYEIDDKGTYNIQKNIACVFYHRGILAASLVFLNLSMSFYPLVTLFNRLQRR